MLRNKRITYFSIVTLVAGISAFILFGIYGDSSQQITYAQSPLYPDEYPEGHPQIPPESSQVPPPQTQIPPESSQVPPPQTQIPPESSQVPPLSPQAPQISPQLPPQTEGPQP